MNDKPPRVVVVAGPNGAGKSTSAPRILRDALGVEEELGLRSPLDRTRHEHPHPAQSPPRSSETKKTSFLSTGERSAVLSTSVIS